MVNIRGNKKLIAASSIAAVLLIAVVAFIVVRSMNTSNDPYSQQNVSTETSSSSTDTTSPSKDETPDSNTTNPNSPSSSDTALDPASVGMVDIAPMSISVSYVKGIGSFEYEVLRATNGTRYVEFRSPGLIGTKCTNDMGTFASVLANPTSDEGATLSKTATIDGTKYGLSLSDATCTSNSDELQKYQKSFNDAFSLLKKLD